jgi:hypothetical protein
LLCRQLGYPVREPVDRRDPGAAACEPKALVTRGGPDPFRHCARLPNALKVLEQPQANGLGDVLHVAFLKAIPSGDPSHQRLQPLDQASPGRLVTLSRSLHQEHNVHVRTRAEEDREWRVVGGARPGGDSAVVMFEHGGRPSFAARECADEPRPQGPGMATN